MTGTPKPTRETRREAAIRRLRTEIEKLAGMPCKRLPFWSTTCVEAFPSSKDRDETWCWPCFCRHLMGWRPQ